MTENLELDIRALVSMARYFQDFKPDQDDEGLINDITKEILGLFQKNQTVVHNNFYDIKNAVEGV